MLNCANWLHITARFAAVVFLLPGVARAAEPITLALPLACEVGKTCFVQNYVDRDPTAKAQDYHCGAQTYDGHDGTDFRLLSMEEQRAGIDVLAASAGVVMGARDGVQDISIRAPGAPSVKGQECGNGVVIRHSEGWVTQYCHMARGSIRVTLGQRVEAGAPLGKVGLSGNTEFPHLHLSVRHDGAKVDPFAYGAADGSCGGGVPLWKEALRPSLQYHRGEVLNAGFAGAPVKAEQVETGEARHQSLTPNSPAMVAYVRAIGLEAGDVLDLSINSPDGRPFAEQRSQPLDHSKAQYFMMVGRKRSAEPWPAGVYTARYKVVREGKDALEKTFTFTLAPAN